MRRAACLIGSGEASDSGVTAAAAAAGLALRTFSALCRPASSSATSSSTPASAGACTRHDRGCTCSSGLRVFHSENRRQPGQRRSIR
ncbi:hypothetical protein [Rhodanobacter lindaniclasticus]